MKVIIETWNDQWRYEVEDDDGERISTGYRDTFSGCCARCLELVVSANNEAAEQSVHPTVAKVAAQEVKSDARNSG